MTARNLPARTVGALLFGLLLAAPNAAAAKGPSGKTKGDHKTSGAATKQSHKKGSPTQPQVSAQPQAPKPAPIDAPPVTLTDPNLVTDKTTSGLSLVVTERRGASGAVVALRVPFGSSADPVDQGGLVALTAKAIASAPVQQQESFRARGGTETVRVEPDGVTFVLTIPAGDTSAAIDLLAAELNAPVAIETAEAARASLTRTTLAEDASALRDALVYQGYFPYEHRATGSAMYLAKVQPSSVEPFRAAHFNVSGATLAVVVPSSATSVVSKAKDTFGSVTTPTTAPPTGTLAEQTNQRASDIQEAGAPTVLYYGWAIRGAELRDLEALDVAGHLLADGGRVTDALAKSGIDGRASTKLERRSGPSLFTLEVDLPSDADVTKAKHTVDDLLAEIGKHAPSLPDFTAAKRSLSIERARELDDDVSLAIRLSRGGPLSEEAQALSALTAEDLPKLAARFLGPLTRSLVETRDPSRPKPVPSHAFQAQAPLQASAPIAKPAAKKEAASKHHSKGHKKP